MQSTDVFDDKRHSCSLRDEENKYNNSLFLGRRRPTVTTCSHQASPTQAAACNSWLPSQQQINKHDSSLLFANHSPTAARKQITTTTYFKQSKLQLSMFMPAVTQLQVTVKEEFFHSLQQ
jgi:carbohydrate-binding DOMON domain-containing protein